MLDALKLVRGHMRDYHALSQYHYRTGRPGTVARIFALHHTAPSVVSRFLHRRDETQTVGVLIESMPALNCQLRDEALSGRFAGWRDRRQRAVLLNAEVRCISRVIIHPQWRGLGLAVRLVRAALDQPTTRYTEALAAMGAVHPFFTRAGMTAYHRPPHPCDGRLAAALKHSGFDPVELALLDPLCSRIAALPQPQRRWLETEIDRWRRASRTNIRPPGETQDARTALRTSLLAARRRLLCQPVYHLHINDLPAAADHN